MLVTRRSNGCLLRESREARRKALDSNNGRESRLSGKLSTRGVGADSWAAVWSLDLQTQAAARFQRSPPYSSAIRFLTCAKSQERALAFNISIWHRANAMNLRPSEVLAPSVTSETTELQTLSEIGQSSRMARRSRIRSDREVGKPCPQPPRDSGDDAVASACRRYRFRFLRHGMPRF